VGLAAVECLALRVRCIGCELRSQLGPLRFSREHINHEGVRRLTGAGSQLSYLAL
jgi:hypothetical protein